MKLVGAVVCAILIAMPLDQAPADDKEAARTNEAAELLAHAAALQDIWAAGSQPFDLHLQVHAERITTKPVDGTVEEVWLAPDKWRREMSFPGFTQIEIGDKDSKWVSRNVDFQPSLAYAISRALDKSGRRQLHPDEKVRAVRTTKRLGADLRCVELQVSGFKRSLCFDPSGTLFREETDAERVEYSDYGQFENKVFPRHIQVFQNGDRVVDIRSEERPLPSNFGPGLFVHGANAQQFASCEQPTPGIPVKRVPPQYPETARAARQQGTVILYILISGDGHVERVKIVQNATPALDQAAADAVRQWVYSPPNCGSTPLPTETEVSTSFTLSVR
ncbi:MAG TPA: energy transducer TonB [Candidatus Sulfotelmatobacter sp.]|nr:energy transducer TonB [Candidatus Sulfotelmatobacter sp.]